MSSKRERYEVHDDFHEKQTVCEVDLETGTCRIMAETWAVEDAERIVDALLLSVKQ